MALHLLKQQENEHVEVHEVSGFASDTIQEAFKEAYAISRGTKCKQFLFSLSLSPPETESVPVAVFEKAIADIEHKIGLVGQPRVIVFHEKEGRRHAHCVWSRNRDVSCYLKLQKDEQAREIERQASKGQGRSGGAGAMFRLPHSKCLSFL